MNAEKAAAVARSAAAVPLRKRQYVPHFPGNLQNGRLDFEELLRSKQLLHAARIRLRASRNGRRSA